MIVEITLPIKKDLNGLYSLILNSSKTSFPIAISTHTPPNIIVNTKKAMITPAKGIPTAETNRKRMGTHEKNSTRHPTPMLLNTSVDEPEIFLTTDPVFTGAKNINTAPAISKLVNPTRILFILIPHVTSVGMNGFSSLLKS